jgi:hypothetical protein
MEPTTSFRGDRPRPLLSLAKPAASCEMAKRSAASASPAPAWLLPDLAERTHRASRENRQNEPTAASAKVWQNEPIKAPAVVSQIEAGAPFGETNPSGQINKTKPNLAETLGFFPRDRPSCASVQGLPSSRRGLSIAAQTPSARRKATRTGAPATPGRLTAPAARATVSAKPLSRDQGGNARRMT